MTTTKRGTKKNAKDGKGSDRDNADDSSKADTRSLSHELQSTNEELQCTIEELQCSIDELKLAQEELRSSNAAAQVVIQSLPTPVLLIDTNFNIILANNCFYHTFKLDKHKVIGQSIIALENGAWNIPDLVNLIRKTISEDISFKDFEVEHKFPGLGLKTMLLNASRVNLPRSKNKAALLAFQDITYKKEREYRKIYNRLTLALEVGRIGTWEYDISTDILKGDQRMLLMHGIRPEQFKYSYAAWMDTIHEHDRERVISQFEKLINENGILNIEYRVVLASKEIRNIHTYATILLEVDMNECSLILGTSIDITDEKKLTHELLKEKQKLLSVLKEQDEINHELESFTYMTSHDLKAPLRGIEHLTTWIENDTENTLSAESLENLRLLRRRVIRMTNLIDGILQYARAGKVDAKLTMVDTKKLLDELIASLNPPKHISFHYTADLPTLFTAQVPLSQVFANLISNAIKYNDKAEGCITISCQELPDFYEFCVSDNGPGIEPDHQTKIFELFHTLQSKDTLESTGIGLSIVKKIVELNDGHVIVESALGQGATFRFTWPKQYANK